MNQYDICTEEIATVIALYSKIPSPEKRIFAQGYLNGLGSISLMENIPSDTIKRSINKKQLATSTNCTT